MRKDEEATAGAASGEPRSDSDAAKDSHILRCVACYSICDIEARGQHRSGVMIGGRAVCDSCIAEAAELLASRVLASRRSGGDTGTEETGAASAPEPRRNPDAAELLSPADFDLRLTELVCKQSKVLRAANAPDHAAMIKRREALQACLRDTYARALAQLPQRAAQGQEPSPARILSDAAQEFNRRVIAFEYSLRQYGEGNVSKEDVDGQRDALFRAASQLRGASGEVSARERQGPSFSSGADTAPRHPSDAERIAVAALERIVGTNGMRVGKSAGHLIGIAREALEQLRGASEARERLAGPSSPPLDTPEDAALLGAIVREWPTVRPFLLTGQWLGMLPDEREAIDRFTNALDEAEDALLLLGASGGHPSDAERWQALLSCGRIRILGRRRDYTHFGAEFWAEPWDIPTDGDGRKVLTEFADAVLRARRVSGEVPAPSAMPPSFGEPKATPDSAGAPPTCPNCDYDEVTQKVISDEAYWYCPRCKDDWPVASPSQGGRSDAE